MSEPATPPQGDLPKSLSIVGVGLIGGSLAAALRRAGYEGKIYGVSRKRSLEIARRANLIDEGFEYTKLVEAAKQSELVVLCAPIRILLKHLEALGEGAAELPEGLIVSDVGSTKREILRAAARCLPETVRFIGGHPLAGSEYQGVEAADPFLFQNAYYVLTPSDNASAKEVDRLSSLIGLTGARVVLLDAEAHDRVAAAISHLPQLLSVALVNFLERLGEHRDTGQRLAAGGFRDMTRIASSPFSVWGDILDTNRDVILETLERFTEDLRAGTAGLELPGLEEAFDRAAQTRGAIPLDTKGFLRRLWDILVEVEDTPATIARLSVPLADKGLNIKDIEVLKVREGEGGTMRLAFESREVALEALAVLEEGGWKARLRE